MAYARACGLAELADNRPLGVLVEGEEVVVVKVGEDVFALEDVCSHAEVALSEGDVENCQIECWMHGSSFDLHTGKPSGPPATEPVATFAVRVEGGDVLVDTDTRTN